MIDDDDYFIEQISKEMPQLTSITFLFDVQSNRDERYFGSLPNVQTVGLNGQFQILTQITKDYFSNVQLINFWIGHVWQEPQPRLHFLIDLLNNFKHLKRLIIYFQSRSRRTEYSSRTELTQLTSSLDIDQIRRNYHLKKTKWFLSCRKI